MFELLLTKPVTITCRIGVVCRPIAFNSENKFPDLLG
jgi:hypothetical protein